MSRQNIIIITVLALSILSGGAYWYYSKKVPLVVPTGEFPGESGVHPGDISITPSDTTGDGSTIFTPGTGSTPPRLYELHKVPVAGVGFSETKDKKGTVMNTAVRYIERGLGHIFETPLSTYKENRIVNETRPRISEALWGNTGKSVVVRSVDDTEGGIIKTSIVNIGASPISFARGTSTEAMSTGFLKTEGVYLPDSIPFMAVAEDNADKLFYLESGSGSVATYKNTNVSKIFSSAFTEWLPQFPNQKLVTLTTRPSATVPGHMFFLDPSTKVVTKILGGINGLTTLTNPTGKLVLYSETKGGVPEVFVYDVAKKESRTLNIQTLPEKCVWSSKKTTVVYCGIPQNIVNAIYPDQWYQGLVPFSDDLWEIDTKTFTTRKIMEPKILGAPVLDMINLVISSDDSFLIFMNKISGTPWVYSILEPVQPKPVTTHSAPATTVTVEKYITSEQTVLTSDMQKLK